MSLCYYDRSDIEDQLSLFCTGPGSPQVISVRNNTLSVVISGQPPGGGSERFEIAYRDSNNVRTLVREVVMLGEYEITGLSPDSSYVVELATIVGTGQNRLVSMPDQITVKTGTKLPPHFTQPVSRDN